MSFSIIRQSIQNYLCKMKNCSNTNRGLWLKQNKLKMVDNKLHINVLIMTEIQLRFMHISIYIEQTGLFEMYEK